MDFQENYERNLEALKTSQPQVATLLSGWEDKLDLVLSQAEGEGFCLALQTNDEQHLISEPAQPALKARQLVHKELPGPPHYDPLLVSGVRAGYELLAFSEKLHKEPGGRWQAMYVLEPSPDLFMAMMHIQDLRPLIASEHSFFFVGPDSLKEMADFFLNDLMKPLPKKVTVLGKPEEAKAAAQILSLVLKKRAQDASKMKKAIDQYYNSLEPLDWVDWLHRGEGLRVLQITSGFSHFVRYANRDISQALQSLGHQTRIIGERQRVDHLTGTALLAAMEEFKPHVIHHIDHMRYESAQIYPEKVLFLTSVLDYFPALENETSASKMGDWDFISGYVGHWEKFGYRTDRLLPQEPMSNEAIFRPLKRDSKQFLKYACEASYISNISKTPEEYLKEVLALFGAGDPAIRKVAGEMFEIVQSRFEGGQILYEDKDYRQILEDVSGHNRIPGDACDGLVNGFFAHVGNAFFRQLPLIALSEAGVDLHLYGRGWEKHPVLAKHARGVAEHGEESNLVFNASRINLHINQFRMRHNRLNDGYAAEAFFLIHRHLDTLAFDVDDILFEGSRQIIEKTKYFLENPEKRVASAATARQVVLEKFTYRAQYQRALKRLGFYFGGTFFDDVIDKLDTDFITSDQGPLCEKLATQSLPELLEQTVGFDLENAMADFFRVDEETGYERNARNIALARSVMERMTEADLKNAKRFEKENDKKHAARYLASALFGKPDDKKLHKRFDKVIKGDQALTRLTNQRKLIKEKSFSLDNTELPFGLTIAPDGRVAFNDWAGVKSTEERAIFLVDPDSGKAEKLSGGPGLQRGDFGPGDAYYAQLLGLEGVFRITPNGRDKIIATGPGTDYGVILQTIVCQNGDLLLHDWTSQGLFLHGENGKHLRTIITPGTYKDIRGINVLKDHLYFISGDQFYHKPLDSNQTPDVFPKPPGGMYDQLIVGKDGMHATIGFFQPDSKGNRIMHLAGLASLDMDGHPRFLSYKKHFVNHPVFLAYLNTKRGTRLVAIDCFHKQLSLFQI